MFKDQIKESAVKYILNKHVDITNSVFFVYLNEIIKENSAKELNNYTNR